MEAYMNSATAERRQTPRLGQMEEHRIIATRVRPGHLARIIDVSAGGALIETMFRLLPGTSVELQVETNTRQTSMRGEVLRCTVVKVRPNGVCYRGAIRFDRHLPWFVEEAGRGIGTPDSRPSHPSRAAVTPEVI
jgi:PilZ domain